MFFPLIRTLSTALSLPILTLFSPLFIYYRSSEEKLIKYQTKNILCDHVLNSHDHSVLQSIAITRRNLMLITLRA